MSNDYVEVEIDEVIAETDRAILVSYDGGEEIWVPRSVIRDGNVYEQGDTPDFIMVAEWFARKESLI